MQSLQHNECNTLGVAGYFIGYGCLDISGSDLVTQAKAVWPARFKK
jgi:hypothetical protein